MFATAIALAIPFSALFFRGHRYYTTLHYTTVDVCGLDIIQVGKYAHPPPSSMSLPSYLCVLWVSTGESLACPQSLLSLHVQHTYFLAD